MNVDSMHSGRNCDAERGSVLAAIALRLKQLENRYPSAAQSLLSIVDQAIVSGTSFLTAAIIGRLTSPDQLGLYYLVLSIVIVGSAVQDSLVSAPYQVYSRRRKGREWEEYSGSVWVQHFVLCGTSIVLLLVLAAILSIAGPPAILPGLWVLLVAAPPILLRQAVRRFAFASLHVRSVIVLDIVVAAVQLGGIALLGYFGMLSLASTFVVMGGACGLACLGIYLIDPPQVRIVRERLRADWALNWSFSKWSLRTYLVGNTTHIILLWMLGLIVGAAATGVFGACSTLIGMANILLFGVDNVLTSQASHEYSTSGVDGLRRLLLRAGMFLASALGTLCVFVAISGDWFMILAFGASGEGTGAVFTLLALTTLMGSISLVAGSGLWAIDRPRANFTGDVCCMAMTLLVAVLLIPTTGVLGAAYAALAGTTAAAIARTIIIVRYLRRTTLHEGNRLSSDVQLASTRLADMARAGIDLQLINQPEAVG